MKGGSAGSLYFGWCEEGGWWMHRYLEIIGVGDKLIKKTTELRGTLKMLF